MSKSPIPSLATVPVTPPPEPATLPPAAPLPAVPPVVVQRETCTFACPSQRSSASARLRTGCGANGKRSPTRRYANGWTSTACDKPPGCAVGWTATRLGALLAQRAAGKSPTKTPEWQPIHLAGDVCSHVATYRASNLPTRPALHLSAWLRSGRSPVGPSRYRDQRTAVIFGATGGREGCKTRPTSVCSTFAAG